MAPSATLDRIRANTTEIRRQRKALQRAETEISLYQNVPGEVGLRRRGNLSVRDVKKRQFQSRNNISSPGYITIPARHYLAKWIVSIPNDPDQCKNVVIRVDRYGGAWRWTGLMHHWTVETIDGVDYITAFFNDDLQFLQFLLAPPNPALPIPVFQFPRDFLMFISTCWGASVMAWMNVVRQETNYLTLPDDPFDPDSYEESLDTRTWQVHVKCPSLPNDSSLWGVFASRMNTVESVNADPLDDAQISTVYRRIFTDEGETIDGLLNNDIANGALVFEFLDRSGFSSADGTYLTGNAVAGLTRTVITWTEDLMDTVLGFIEDDESLTPDEYWQSGFLGTLAKKPAVCIRDSPYNDLQCKVSYSPASATQVIVGGDNPAADALAQTIISSVGNLLGYFFLFGFDSAGTIAADLIMPFLVGTVAAWDQFELGARATNLGWVHLWEILQSGAEQNAWSLSAIAAARGGVKDTADETSGTMVMDSSTWVIPGLHYGIGDRLAYSSGALQRMGIDLLLVAQAEEMTESGDDTGKSEFLTKVGKNKAAMSRAERDARQLKKAMDRIADIGVHLVS